jgi:hypothetical protein
MKKVKVSAVHFNCDLEQKPWEETQPCGNYPSGFRVRAGVHVGAWWCNSCVGKTEGSQLIQPNCDYCQIS